MSMQMWRGPRVMWVRACGWVGGGGVGVDVGRVCVGFVWLRKCVHVRVCVCAYGWLRVGGCVWVVGCGFEREHVRASGCGCMCGWVRVSVRVWVWVRG